jgi:hypothetical protein
MTNQNNADPAKAGKLAQQIVAILIDEDPLTRQRAMQAAMMLLGEPSQQYSNGRSLLHSGGHGGVDHGNLAEFFSRDGDLKPADYAQLCAAYCFSLYGTAPFSLAELRAIATEAGVVVPDRLDMTLCQATKKGKRLFQSAGRGLFRPTAAAGLMFGERWGVKPGKNVKGPPGAGTVE